MKKHFAIVLSVFIVLIISGCSKKINKTTLTQDVTEQIETQVTTGLTSETTEDREVSDTVEKNILIAIDPGHQAPNVDMSATEPNAPGSSNLKVKATGGTTGKYSGVPEYQLNLDISLMLKDALLQQGYDVILTREDNETAISNKERAEFANTKGADISIRIHANGSEDSSANGALVLVGSTNNPYVGSLYEKSYQLGNKVLSAYCDETGMANLGIQNNDTMTGINWSQIPVIILEMGFMSNESDDLNMADASYRKKMVTGIVNGINDYYKEVRPNEKGNEDSFDMSTLEQEIQLVINQEKEKGNKISVCVQDINSEGCIILEDVQMKAASLIKLYIAGCVYEENNYSSIQSSDMEELIDKMLSKSDNDATNTLILDLGNGNADEGMKKVNDFCKKHAFSDTSIGRLMLDFDARQDNYTSVSDCANFLKAVYKGDIIGSESILNYLLKQERTEKLPAGVPLEINVANKTGELKDVENDAAIFLVDRAPYIVTVMMSDLKDTAAARKTIKNISNQIYHYMENQ